MRFFEVKTIQLYPSVSTQYYHYHENVIKTAVERQTHEVNQESLHSDIGHMVSYVFTYCGSIIVKQEAGHIYYIYVDTK